MASFQTFDLLVPKRTVFGWGKRSMTGELAAQFGGRAFVVDGSRTLRKTQYWNEIHQSLKNAGVSLIEVATALQEPSIEDVDQATSELLKHNPVSGDFVLAIGGGAALDLGKALAAMSTNSGGRSIREFLEGIGTGQHLTQAPLPVMAMPTTAGTGSEATKNAVISCHNPPCKKSIRSDRLLPEVVLIDPELTVSMTPTQTAYSGLDTITQLLESYTSRKSQPATEAICMFGLDLALPSIRTAFNKPNDRTAREQMALAAYYSGLALANSGLGLAHGVAAALGSIGQVPHGLACAVMLPITLRTNLDVIRDKFEDLDLAHLLSSKHPDFEDAETVIDLIEQLCRDLKIPRRLRDLGIQREQLPAIVTGSAGNSLSGNPLTLSETELLTLLENHW